VTLILIPEKRPGRLGRHVEHDPASKAFATTHATAPLVSALHARTVLPFDQGELGSCTGNAMAGLLSTAPFSLELTEDDAVTLYKAATKLDKIPGHYPPDDTGSSGLAVAKAAHNRGWLRAYHHAFTLHAALASLGRVPTIAGINWYEGFDRPGSHGELLIAGSVRGGHEVELLGIDVEAQTVRGCNSWGPDWADHGYFTMSFATLDRLLSELGDVIVPVFG